MDDFSSDSESDCFESASESFDESEDVINFNSKKHIRKSESKSEEPYSNEDSKDQSFCQNVKNLSDNLVTYRKRPERMKTDTNKSPTKVTNPNKLNHKTDVAPDVFLQDLTSNFSKNINKSLNSLQQTSCNVKDLILNSLPISNSKKNTEFSYDDNTSYSFQENLFKNDDLNQAEFLNTKDSIIDKIEIMNMESFDNFSVSCEESCEEEKTKVKKINIDSNKNESIEAKLENLDENMRLINNKVETKEDFEKQKEKYYNVEKENQKCENNEIVNEIVLETQTTFKEAENTKHSDSLKSDIAKKLLEQSFAEFHEELHKQSCIDLSTEKTLKKTDINKQLSNSELENNENSLMKTTNSSWPTLDNSEALFVNNDKKIDNNSDSNINKHDHSLQAAQSKSFDNVEPLETFKSIDAFVEIYEKEKKTDFFDYKQITDNLEKNFFSHETDNEFIKKNENFNKNNKENVTSEKDCVNPDLFELQNEALTKNDLISVNKKSFLQNANQLESQIYDKKFEEIKNDKSDIIISDISPENKRNVGESKCEISKTMLEKEDNIDTVQCKEINSSLVKNEVKEEETDDWTNGWADEWTADFSFSKNEEKNLEENRDKCLNKKEASEVDVKNLEIKGKHLDICSKISTDSFSTMSEDEYQESDLEEIKENETKGPIEDWDWDTWDDVDDSNNNISLNINKTPEVKKLEISDIERWEGWDTFGSKPSENQSNWGLWGVNLLLNKATAVTQGISNVVEAGLGAPDPETLARMEKLERDSQKKEKDNKEIEKAPFEEKFIPKVSSSDSSMFPVFGLTNLVAGVTSKIVEHSKIQEIGSKVITGGLDTLESFGKKTMEVLQEGDPGLKNKRALLLGTNKPILSQVLKEAKEKAEKEIKKVEEKEMAKKCHFEGLFDDFQGMVHLEALEMLSTQSSLKLEQLRLSMTDEEKDDLKEILEEVEQLCYLEEYDLKNNDAVVDFKLSLSLAVEALKNEISLKKIIEVQEEVNKWLEHSVEIKPSIVLVHQKVVSTLAQLTAATIHQFHKTGELLSVKECRKTVEEIEALSKMTNVICMEIKSICERFTKLSENLFRETGDINQINEKINLVMTDSTSYIKQAFNLLIPVLQVGAAA